MSRAVHPAHTPVHNRPTSGNPQIGASSAMIPDTTGNQPGVVDDAMDEDVPEQEHRPLDATLADLRPTGASQLPTPQR